VKAQPMPHDPKTTLVSGAQIIARFLGPHGFQFELKSQGRGSGGSFASGRFVRDERYLEIHSDIRWGMESPIRAHRTSPTCAS
jgi:hypothetical protein